MADRITARPPRVSHADHVQALFDSKSVGWSSKYAPDSPLAGRLTQFADAVITRVAPGGELLDLGCGTGEIARHLAAVGYRVTGCDIAPQMLSRASAADKQQSVRWIQLDPEWRTLPFAPKSLDAVVAASVLEYADDPAAVLRECARLLRPGGTVLCTVPNQAHPVRWLEWPLIWVARTPLAHLAAGAHPRLPPYLAYLQVSRHRRPVRWWRNAARQAGLQPQTRPAKRGPRMPLRLLALTKAGLPSAHC
jgi:SAM-dependent methyltransferase